jgi:hypothetical protein
MIPRRPRRAACRVSAAWCRARRACSPARWRLPSSRRPPSACNSPLSAMPERCAPTTAMAISSPLASAGNAASGGCAGPWRPSVSRCRHGRRGRCWRARVVAGGRQQRDAERNAVGAHRGRQRQPAEVEQVDEIGVGAEPAVELDRIGQHLRGRIGGRRRRQHHRVDIGKGALGDAAQRLQPIERGEGIGRGQPRAGAVISRVTGWIESGDDASRSRITR